MLGYMLAGVLFVSGIVSATRSLAEPPTEGRARDRILMAIHDVAKAMFWLSLGGFFLADALAGGRTDVRWLLLVPLGMAALRLVSAAFAARS